MFVKFIPKEDRPAIPQIGQVFVSKEQPLFVYLRIEEFQCIDGETYNCIFVKTGAPCRVTDWSRTIVKPNATLIIEE